ncbi:MAG: four-carbon acid sugar kinase family protein [Christensenellales bacterium]|jgi:uncharacterized protein YgbK (DUF1537 family)
MMNYFQTMESFPTIDHVVAQRLLDEASERSKHKIIVLDDDPTGTQTVHDVAVLTGWNADAIQKELKMPARLFYILTNSRGLTREQTIALHTEIAKNIHKAAKALNIQVLIVCRGDSTLRGHYPHETQAIYQELERLGEKPIDGEILCPYFKEGGRLTLFDTHYLVDGERLVPVNETEFAKDRTFSYKHANLPAWVQEKTEGAFTKNQVASVRLEELRAMDMAVLSGKLKALTGFQKLVVNATEDADVKVFAAALLGALTEGKRFLIQSAAGLVKVLDNKADRPLLSADELSLGQAQSGGLVVVGSHVKKTSDQLAALKSLPELVEIEMNQHLALDSERFQEEVTRVSQLTEAAVKAGRTALVYTRRERLDLPEGHPEDELRLSRTISNGLTDIVRKLATRPRYLIAKGGITSSDIGVFGLGVRRAVVWGQVLPGVPVWKTGEESRFPGLPYVIFPGNVGKPDDLKNLVQALEGLRTQSAQQSN